MAGVRWLPTVGSYQVSDSGQIMRSGHILKPFKSRGGYSLVKLSIDGITANRLVHELVARAFIGPRPAGLEINHIDGSKDNNSSNNLEYITPSENMRHAIRIGLMNPPPPILDYEGSHWTTKNPEKVRGELNGRSKLTEDEVRIIRQMRSASTLHELARRFKVSPTLIYNICSRKAWRHI